MAFPQVNRTSIDSSSITAAKTLHFFSDNVLRKLVLWQELPSELRLIRGFSFLHPMHFFNLLNYPTLFAMQINFHGLIKFVFLYWLILLRWLYMIPFPFFLMKWLKFADWIVTMGLAHIDNNLLIWFMPYTFWHGDFWLSKKK